LHHVSKQFFPANFGTNRILGEYAKQKLDDSSENDNDQTKNDSSSIYSFLFFLGGRYDDIHELGVLAVALAHTYHEIII
jgi:hypothetical protein